ncbi:hypothetical protein [Bacillus sp. UNCCL13]|nr:hypothetical protein [Bacillus sp. UNCCL13]
MNNERNVFHEMNYFQSKMPVTYYQAQQYALPPGNSITNDRINKGENNSFTNGPFIQNEIPEAEKKEQIPKNNNPYKPKASHPLIFTPPKVPDRQIKYKQIMDYEESEDYLSDETEEIHSSELETQFLMQLSEQEGSQTKEMVKMNPPSDEDNTEKYSSADGIGEEESKDHRHSITIQDESSSIENGSILNEDLVKQFTSMLEESSSYSDESSSREESSSSFAESSSLEESSTGLDESSSLKESSSSFDESSSLEESSSQADESSSPEESSSQADESSSLEESSSQADESSSLEESSSQADESSSLDESSSQADESSSPEESSSQADESSSLDESSSSDKESSTFINDESSEESSSLVCYLDKGKVQVHHPIVKIPVLLSLLKVDIDIYDSFNLFVPVSSVIKVNWSINSLDCKVLLPSSNVFLKGELIADIEYVKDNVESTLHSIKIIVPYKKVIVAEWLHSPNLPSTHEAEYMFISPDRQDVQYHREFTQRYAEPVYCELHGTHSIWHDELISKNGKPKLDIQGKGTLTISLLQSQYVEFNNM